MSANPFTDDVVDAVCRHMNEDHADDTLLICRALGQRADASAARVVGVDADGLDLVARTPSGEVGVRIPFAARLGAREQIRAEVVRLYREACHLLGVEPRGEAAGGHATGGTPHAAPGTNGAHPAGVGATAQDAEASSGFAQRLRQRTWADHQRTERAGFVQALLAGRLSRGGYEALVAQHWFIYRALEEAAEVMRGEPTAAPFVFDELDRVPALELDLAHLLGPTWRERVVASPATRRYVDRIRATCSTWPGGFVAHHYTRYLGDLSGGQAIRRVVARRYGLVDLGVRFYDFDRIPDVDAFKREYRRRLDQAPWDEAEQERVIDEIVLAYALNTEVFEDLTDDLHLYTVA